MSVVMPSLVCRSGADVESNPPRVIPRTSCKSSGEGVASQVLAGVPECPDYPMHCFMAVYKRPLTRLFRRTYMAFCPDCNFTLIESANPEEVQQALEAYDPLSWASLYSSKLW